MNYCDGIQTFIYSFPVFVNDRDQNNLFFVHEEVKRKELK